MIQYTCLPTEGMVSSETYPKNSMDSQRILHKTVHRTNIDRGFHAEPIYIQNPGEYPPQAHT